MTFRKAFALCLLVLPAVAVGLALLVADLPDPVPSHWNARGDVDRTMGHTAFVVLNLVLTAAPVVAAVLYARAERARLGVTAFAFAAYLMGSLGVMTALLASGVTDARDVELPWYALVPALAGAFAGSAAVYLLWPKPLPEATEVEPVPGTELGPDERVVYVKEVRSRGFVVLAIGCAVIGLVLALAVDVMIGAAVLAVTAAALVLQRALVRIDAEGLRIDFGLGVRTRVPLNEIRRAGTDDIRPLEWGGWGYRVAPGRRALVLRSGPGLVLDLADGSRFAVTLDDPREAAAVLNGLVARFSAD